jgi:hypothetical protein
LPVRRAINILELLARLLQQDNVFSQVSTCLLRAWHRVLAERGVTCRSGLESNGTQAVAVTTTNMHTGTRRRSQRRIQLLFVSQSQSYNLVVHDYVSAYGIRPKGLVDRVALAYTSRGLQG